MKKYHILSIIIFSFFITTVQFYAFPAFSEELILPEEINDVDEIAKLYKAENLDKNFNKGVIPSEKAKEQSEITEKQIPEANIQTYEVRDTFSPTSSDENSYLPVKIFDDDKQLTFFSKNDISVIGDIVSTENSKVIFLAAVKLHF